MGLVGAFARIKLLIKPHMASAAPVLLNSGLGHPLSGASFLQYNQAGANHEHRMFEFRAFVLHKITQPFLRPRKTAQFYGI